MATSIHSKPLPPLTYLVIDPPSEMVTHITLKDLEQEELEVWLFRQLDLIAFYVNALYFARIFASSESLFLNNGTCITNACIVHSSSFAFYVYVLHFTPTVTSSGLLFLRNSTFYCILLIFQPAEEKWGGKLPNRDPQPHEPGSADPFYLNIRFTTHISSIYCMILKPRLLRGIFAVTLTTAHRRKRSKMPSPI